jgi:hypothetical protein
MTVSGGPPASATGQLVCFCCGAMFAASELIRFEKHPGEGVCAQCASWLYHHSQPAPPNRRQRVWRRHGRGRWRRE